MNDIVEKVDKFKTKLKKYKYSKSTISNYAWHVETFYQSVDEQASISAQGIEKYLEDLKKEKQDISFWRQKLSALEINFPLLTNEVLRDCAKKVRELALLKSAKALKSQRTVKN